MHPDWQGRGVGKALYQTVIDHLATLGAREITAMVWQAHPRAARFLIDRGFAEVWRRLDSRLDVADFDWTPYAGLEEQITSLGIQVKTYAELADDPDRLTEVVSARLGALAGCSLWPAGIAPLARAICRRRGESP